MNGRRAITMIKTQMIPGIFAAAGATMNGFGILHVALLYLVAVNLVTFFIYGIDKFKSKRAKWRVPEATLLGLAAVGGCIGAWLGMKLWHHKTLHKKFRYGIPLILIAQIAIVLLAVWGRG